MTRVFKFDLVSKRISEETLAREDGFVVWSSRPYPAIFVDRLNVAQTIVGGRLRESVLPLPVEAVNVNHLLSGGLLRDVLQNYQWPVEQMNVSHSMTGGLLRDVLKNYQWPTEQMDVSHSMTGGLLRDVLLTYSAWPVEQLNVNHTLTGGLLQ